MAARDYGDCTAQEHLDWAKERAIEELNHAGPAAAYASLASDLRKHAGTQRTNLAGAPLAAEEFDTQGDFMAAFERFIEGLRLIKET